ncbi:sensor histidine kinase [Planctomycetes bacterium K23_9]|uniref:histidine kinase n=1 Tax=Stieleria marina TaxID=1930275 RepID=A0A517NY01_9BACT|nr:Signal transduction histidine-protein kinase ArlS [Planctomycetes bacterium K23_9]
MKRHAPPDVVVGGKKSNRSLYQPVRNFTKSIAWRLQFWHATILFCVVVGLSTLWFLQARRARLNAIDAELLSAARVLDGSLRGFPFITSAPRESSPVPILTRHGHQRLSLPRENVDREDGKLPPYLAIWLSDGRLLRSARVPENVVVKFQESMARSGFSVQQRDALREVRIVGPRGSQILVGRDLTAELGELRRLAFQIIAFATCISSAGLFGGWWLARAVLRPISAMSDAASRFSVADMSPRIDVVETDSELGELATILNGAFDRVDQSFDQQRQFAADASHELRTPLAVIQSQIELALKKERTSAEYAKTLAVCASAGDRLSDLVDSLLTLARLDAGEKPAIRTPVRLDLVAAKCIDLMRPLAEHADVKLEGDFGTAVVLGDRKQLERAVLNLLKNSIEYNHRDGSVELVVEASETTAELIVRDTGIGISEEELVRVTKRFYRVDKARTRQQGGSGLGLSIAEQIIETHGGTFQISSELGRGTTTSVRIPVCDQKR